MDGSVARVATLILLSSTAGINERISRPIARLWFVGSVLTTTI